MPISWHMTAPWRRLPGPESLARLKPAFHDVTDHPLGPGHIAQVRNNYTNSATRQGPLLTFLRTLGVNGEGAAALPAVKGYDDATGVGSPRLYILSFH